MLTPLRRNYHNMIEDKYEIVDADRKIIYATGMDKQTALILLGAMFDYYYNDTEMQLIMRKVAQKNL